MKDERRPSGVTALSLFFALCGVISGVMAMLVLFPGSVGTPATQNSSPIMIMIGLLLMIAASLASIVASVGLWKCARWGLYTALVLLCANIFSEFIDLITTQQWRNLIGFPLSALIIWYLWQKKPVFEQSGQAALPQAETHSAHTSA